ncbi:MAG TPA: glycosyltransferase family 4 protein [Thermoanaerobaculia bacterium]|nr:glycosyltransferase family 4 protein [Thermoanaerobaculia bacterium]
MLHVALVTPAYPPAVGGIATYVGSLATSLVRQGQRVTVFWADFDRAPGTDEVASPEPSLRVIRLGRSAGLPEWLCDRLTGLPAAAWSFRVRRALRDLHRRDPLDLVELSNWKALGAAHSLAKIVPQVTRVTTGIRHVQALQGTAGSREARSVRRLQSMEALEVRRSDAIIVPSRRHWAEAAAEYGLPLDDPRVEYVEFGIDSPRTVDSAPSAPSNERPCELLFVGRLTWRKGFDVLMRAWPAVAAGAGREVRLTLIGADGPAGDAGGSAWRTCSAALDSSLCERIEYLGQVSDARRDEAYRRCDVFVAPSRYESFGLIYVEAMARGLPVVGCRRGGAPDVVEDGVTGLLVEPDDAEGLARALLRLIRDPELRHRLGDEGRRQATSRFTLESMAARTLDVYRRAIARRRAERRS